MKTPIIPLLGAAVLLAACGGSASISTSKSKAVSPASGIELRTAANAGSDVSNADVIRVNQAIHKAATPITPVAPRVNLPAPAASPVPMMDRCSSGLSTGTGASGNRAVVAGKRPPLPMCLPQ
jgi:hypothetical protein